MRMVLAGPSSLAELTAGQCLAEPLERSNWLVMELQHAAGNAGASSPPEQPCQQPH